MCEDKDDDGDDRAPAGRVTLAIVFFSFPMFASEKKEGCVKSEEFAPPAVLRSVDWLMFIIFLYFYSTRYKHRTTHELFRYC